MTTVDGCEILHQLIGGKHPIIFRFQPSKVVQDFATIHSRTQVRYIQVVQWGKLNQVATGGTILTDTWSLNVPTSHWARFDDPFINQGFGIGSRIFGSPEKEKEFLNALIWELHRMSLVWAHKKTFVFLTTFRRLRIPHLQMDQDVCAV